MIKELEEAIQETLRKGLSELIPSENIIIGEADQKTAKSISILNTGFTIEELGIGGSGGVKKEDIVEKFDSDAKKKDFKLTHKPLRPLISVESPPGTIKNEPNDYTVNYAGGIIFFRMPPDKGKGNVQIKYYIARAVGETRNLKLILTYSLTVWSNDLIEKNRLTFETIKVLYREKASLAKCGISDIKLIKGYLAKADETKNLSVIEYQVQSTIQIEMPLPPIEKIEIGKAGK